ncbi:MAG: hypothetical protein SFY56_14795 [Bacteroidota bacterium]|nr:hypothetical protein [Bacteroidota bacterium]
MRTKLVLLSVILLALFFSCGEKNDEDAFRKAEEKRIQAQLNNPKLELYKAMKIALRSTATVGKNPELDKARQSMFNLVGSVFKSNASDKSVEINPLELIVFAKEVYDSKETLLKTDEDSLPTLLGNIFYLFTNSPEIKSSYFPFAYNNNSEHMILSLLWQTTPSAPKDFALYEIYKSNENNINDVSMKLVYQLCKSFVFYENTFYYHSFDKCNDYLKYMESNKDMISKTPIISVVDQNIVANEQNYYQLHAMGLIMRALNEREMDKEKESLNDMKFFLADMEKGGLDNELTWLVSAYVYVSEEEYEKALPALEKLEKSSIISEPEKQAMSELKGYIKSRKKGNALNVINDKLAFGKITVNLLSNRLKSSKQLLDLEKSKEGKKLIQVQEEMNSKMNYLEDTNKSLNVDSLSAKAKNLLDGVLK